MEVYFMKKLLLCFLVFFVFAACSSKDDADTDDENVMDDSDHAVNDEVSDETGSDPDDAVTEDPDDAVIVPDSDDDVVVPDDDQPDDDVIVPCDDVWTDPETDFMWENCPKLFQGNWSGAINYCNNLVHGDFDDWRLPTLTELRTLVKGCPDTVTGGACKANDDCLDEFDCLNHPCSVPDCNYNEGPANGCYRDGEIAGECDYHWSSKESATYDDSAWYIDFMNGVINPTEKSWKELYGRCVRDAETEENDDDEMSDEDIEQEPFSIKSETKTDGANSYKIYTANFPTADSTLNFAVIGSATKKKVSAFVTQHSDISPKAVINGGYFGGSETYSYSKGSFGWETTTGNAKGPRACIAYDSVTRKARIVQSNGKDNLGNSLFPDETDVACAGPQLVKDGINVSAAQYIAENFETSGISPDSKLPRSAACIKNDGSIVLIMAQHETVRFGMTLNALANYLISIGCVDALNLDGGGSTAFWTPDKYIIGEEDRSVFNGLMIY
jgi:exopolysaccharide biosynthesis protein